MATEFSALPETEACRLIDFTDAEVRPAFLPSTFVLIVWGTKPYLNMDVRLIPRVYKQQPEYWEIEVVGCLAGVGLPAEAPYHVSLPLDGIRGTAGIEVVGATRRTKLPVS